MLSARSSTITACGGLILAGGQSSRMGRDKAMLCWQGQPLLVHMRGVLQQAGAAPILISGDYPAHGGVADATPGMGPLGGLATLAESMDDGDWWLLPVDMPLLDAELLRRLRPPSEPAAACVCFEEHVLPMRLRMDNRLRDVLRQLLALPSRQRSLHALQQALGVQRLALPAGAADKLAACNTPAQWQQLQD